VEQVHLCLFDSAAAREVLTGDHGLRTTDLRGKLLVDHTTNHFGEVLALHDLCARAGATYLEAPVLGSVVPAAQGSLTVLVSGSRAGFDRAEPVLRQLGTHLFHLEEPGLATRMKLVNNLVLAGLMAQIAEATAFAEAAGMDRATALDILAAGAGQSMVLNAKRAKLESGDFSPHFTTSLMLKDLHILQDLAYAEGRPLFTGAMPRELFALAVAEGMEALDFSSVYRLFSRR
jgi:3-hydroxyisobutyrate dehydrogenase